MKRQDIGDNIVEIKHNKVTESWLVIKEMLDATKVRGKGEIRKFCYLVNICGVIKQ